jgi:hypothetical protein
MSVAVISSVPASASHVSTCSTAGRTSSVRCRPMDGSDRLMYSVECALLASMVLVTVMTWLIRRLRASRPGLRIAWPLAVAATVRLAAAAVLGSSPQLAALAGPDEGGFLRAASAQAASSSTPHWVTHELVQHLFASAGGLNREVLVFQFHLLGSPGTFSLRIVQITVAVAGICLLAAAVYDLFGPRAALIAAWLFALEPAGIFFSGLLNKEGFVILGEGLAALGVARLWKKRDARAWVLTGAGCLVVAASRPYAGAFLVLGCLLAGLHAAVRPSTPGLVRSPRLAAALAAVLAVFTLGAAAGSNRILTYLSHSQRSYETSPANLPLEPVDFSTPSGVVRGFPIRLKDFLLRPYPWQVANTSQRLGLLGSLIFWTALASTITMLVLDRRAALARAGPFLYLAAVTTAGYTLSTANAGTGFRYRLHLTLFLLALVAGLTGYGERGERLAAWLARLPRPQSRRPLSPSG